MTDVSQYFDLFALEESTDGGTSWAMIGRPPGTGIQSIVFDPNTPTTLYISMDSAGVYKSTDGGNTWTTHGPATTNCCTALVMDPADPNTLYAGTVYQGVYQTTDGGQYLESS